MHRLLRICDFEKVEEVQEKEDFLDGFPSLKWQQVIAVIEANFETEPTYNLRTGPFFVTLTTFRTEVSKPQQTFRQRNQLSPCTSRLPNNPPILHQPHHHTLGRPAQRLHPISRFKTTRFA